MTTTDLVDSIDEHFMRIGKKLWIVIRAIRFRPLILYSRYNICKL